MLREPIVPSQELAERTQQALRLNQIGWNLEKLGRHEEALVAHRDALGLWREEDDGHGQSWSLGWIGSLLLKVSRPDELRLVIEQAGRLPVDHRYDFVRISTDAVTEKAQEAGRGEAFALAQKLLGNLLVEGTDFAPRPTLEAFFTGLLQDDNSPSVIRDLVPAARSLSRADVEPTLRAIELALDYIESGEDEAILQSADPDLAAAVRTIVNAI